MKRGFTTTELLVVIAIVGALTGILFPLVRGFQKSANQAGCLSNLRSFGPAVEAAKTDNLGFMPGLSMGRKKEGDRSDVMEEYFLDYGLSADSFKCPADHEEFPKSGSSYFWNQLISGAPELKLAVMGMDTETGVIPIISDKESFHGDENGTNFLFADMSAGSELKYDVASH